MVECLMNKHNANQNPGREAIDMSTFAIKCANNLGTLNRGSAKAKPFCEEDLFENSET